MQYLDSFERLITRILLVMVAAVALLAIVALIAVGRSRFEKGGRDPRTEA